MAHIPTLPEEVLAEIFSHLSVQHSPFERDGVDEDRLRFDTLVNACSASRALRRIATPLRWRTLDLDNSGDQYGTLEGVLATLVCQPELRCYVKHLRITLDDGEVWDFRRQKRLRWEMEQIAGASSFLRSLRAPFWNFREHWTDDALLTVLVCLCPNIEEMCLLFTGYKAAPIFLHVIREAHMIEETTTTTAPLHNLLELAIAHPPDDIREVAQWAPLMALPNLEVFRIHGPECDADFIVPRGPGKLSEFRHFELRDPPTNSRRDFQAVVYSASDHRYDSVFDSAIAHDTFRQSRLEHIELRNIYPTGHGLRRLFKFCPALEELALIWDDEDSDDKRGTLIRTGSGLRSDVSTLKELVFQPRYRDVDEARSIGIVLKHPQAFSSLVELTVTAWVVLYAMPALSCEALPASLRTLNVLKDKGRESDAALLDAALLQLLADAQVSGLQTIRLYQRDPHWHAAEIAALGWQVSEVAAGEGPEQHLLLER